MAKSKIQWTDEVWNPTTGCSKVSPGCKFCYAEKLWPRFTNNPKLPEYQGRTFTDVRTHPNRLTQPRQWKKPRRVFVNSMSDLFHEDIPDWFIDQAFAVMAVADQHTYQILTKRSGRALEYMGNPNRIEEIYAQWHGVLDVPAEVMGWPLPNVWMGVSIENQAEEKRISDLLKIPAAVRFLSCEPMLGPIDLYAVPQTDNGYFQWRGETGVIGPKDEPDDFVYACKRGIHWVICGGESGPNARPMHPDWARLLRDQCKEADVPFFFKQHGQWLHESQEQGDYTNLHYAEPMPRQHDWGDGTVSFKVRDKGLQLLDGELLQAFPKTKTFHV